METKKLKAYITSLYDYAEEYFNSDRYDKTKKLIANYKEQIVTSPASSRSYYHHCYPGGWVEHTIEVIDNALRLVDIWVDKTQDFEMEELVFSAMFHDLGKLGYPGYPLYKKQTSNWHRKKGMLYTFNNKINYMTAPERTLFILQNRKFKITEREFLAIRLSNGPFNDNNKAYYKNFEAGPAVDTFLPWIIHQADFTSAKKG